MVFGERPQEFNEVKFARIPALARPASLKRRPTTRLRRDANAALPSLGRLRGATKQQVTVRLDTDLIEKLRETGPGWQTRMNAELRKAVGI